MTLRRTFIPISAKVLIAFAFLPFTPSAHSQLWSRHQKSILEEQQAAQTRQLMQTVDAAKTAALTDGSDTTPAVSTVPEKRAGVVRIGVTLPVNKLAGKGQLNDGEPWRAAELQVLTGPTLEAVALKSILLEQALAEAQLLGCDYVLTTSIAQQPVEAKERFAKLGGMRTLQIAATAAQFVPAVSAGAMVANMAVSTVASHIGSPMMAGLGPQVKTNSDITLEYTLTDPHAAVIVSGTERRRTSTDGDSVVTAMLSTIAGKVAAATTR